MEKFITMSKASFRGLSGKQARLEFALVLLHTMPESEGKTRVVFSEARKGNVLDPETLKELEQEALDLLPVKMFYQDHETRKMKAHQAFRDKVLGYADAS